MPHSRNKSSQKSNSTTDPILDEHAGKVEDPAQVHGGSLRSRQGTVSSNGEEGISRTSTNTSIVVNTAWKRRWDHRMEATKLFDPENRKQLIAVSSGASVPLASPPAEQTAHHHLSTSSPASASVRSRKESDWGGIASENRGHLDKAPSSGNISALNLPSNLRLDQIQPFPDLEQEILRGLCDSPSLKSCTAGSLQPSTEAEIRTVDSIADSQSNLFTWGDDKSALSLTPYDSVSQCAYPSSDELEVELSSSANELSQTSPTPDLMASLEFRAHLNKETVDHSLEKWLDAIDQVESSTVESLRVDSKSSSDAITKKEAGLKIMEDAAQADAQDVVSRARLELAKDLVRLSSVLQAGEPGNYSLSLSNPESDDLATIEQCLQQIEAAAGTNRRQRFLDLVRRFRIVFAKTLVTKVEETEPSGSNRKSSDNYNLREQQRLRSLARLEGRLVGPRTPSVRSEAVEESLQARGLGIHVAEDVPGPADGRTMEPGPVTPKRPSVTSKRLLPEVRGLSKRSSNTSSDLSMLHNEQATFRHMARLAAYQHELQMSNRFQSPAVGAQTLGFSGTETRHDGNTSVKCAQPKLGPRGNTSSLPSLQVADEKLLVKSSPKHEHFVPERDSQFIRDLRELAQQRTAEAAATPPALRLAHPAFRDKASPRMSARLSPEKTPEIYHQTSPASNESYTPNPQQARGEGGVQSNVDLRKRAVRNLQESTRHREVEIAERKVGSRADEAAQGPRSRQIEHLDILGGVEEILVPSRSENLSHGEMQEPKQCSTGAIPTKNYTCSYTRNIDRKGATLQYARLNDESPRTSICVRELGTSEKIERLQVEEDFDEAMNHWANVPESPSISDAKPKDCNVVHSFQNLRYALRIPLLRNRSECERPHPNHPYQWDTIKIMCRGSHSSLPLEDLFLASSSKCTSVNTSFSSSTSTAKLKECDFCSETCCYYKRLARMVNVLHIVDGNVPDLEMRASEALGELRRTYPDGIEAFETLMECWYCSRTFCPNCGVVCKQLFCRQPICKGCHTTEDSCQDH